MRWNARFATRLDEIEYARAYTKQTLDFLKGQKSKSSALITIYDDFHQYPAGGRWEYAGEISAQEQYLKSPLSGHVYTKCPMDQIKLTDFTQVYHTHPDERNHDKINFYKPD